MVPLSMTLIDLDLAIFFDIEISETIGDRAIVTVKR